MSGDCEELLLLLLYSAGLTRPTMRLKMLRPCSVPWTFWMAKFAGTPGAAGWLLAEMMAVRLRGRCRWRYRR